MFVSVASEHLPQGPTRPLNKGLLVGANWARGLERTSQLGANYLYYLETNYIKNEQTAVSLQEQSLTSVPPSIFRKRRACRVREKSHSRPNLQQRGSRPVRRLPIADCF